MPQPRQHVEHGPDPLKQRQFPVQLQALLKSDVWLHYRTKGTNYWRMSQAKRCGTSEGKSWEESIATQDTDESLTISSLASLLSGRGRGSGPF